MNSIKTEFLLKTISINHPNTNKCHCSIIIIIKEIKIKTKTKSHVLFAHGCLFLKTIYLNKTKFCK